MPGRKRKPVSVERSAESLRAERQLAEVERIARVGSFELDLVAGTAEWSEECYRLLGFAPGEVPATLDNFMGRVHVADRTKVRDDLALAIRDGTHLDLEFRVIWSDDEVRWLHSRGWAVRDSAGRPVRFVGTSMDVTERRRAEEALRQSEQRYRSIVETSHEGVWLLDAKAFTLYVNRRMHEMLGCGPDEMIGRHLFDFMDAEGRRIAESHLERGARDIAEDHEFRFRRRDGEDLWTIIATSPVHDSEGTYAGALGMVMDITQRKQAEDALRRSEQRLQFALDATAEGLWDWNLSTGEVHFSPHWGESLGYSPNEIIPTVDFWKSVVHPEDLPRVMEAVQAHFDGRTATYECEDRLRMKSGQYRDNLDRGKVVEWDPEGRPLRMVGTDTDMTQRKQAEAERLRMEAQFQQTQKLESLGVLAGGIAHDFSNLLTGILGNIDLALFELPEGLPARELIGDAREAARRAAELTRQMLAYSGRGRFVVAPVDVSSLVRDMSSLLRVSISKRCTLELDLPEGLPAVEADGTQIRQVLMNLVINASEALGDADGGVTVTTGAGHFDRAGLAEGGFDPGLPEGSYVWLEVADTGIGMPEPIRTRIFEPFFTTKFTGRGLGLSAVLGIMRGHRGSISCASEPGKGTTFKAIFPASSRPARGPEPQASGDRAWRGSGTVLVVDDEESVRRVAQRLLQGLSFRVLLAKDGREGVDVFRSEGSTIDLVLLDMTMPHLDGPGALREMRRIRSDIKVILSSGYNEETAVAEVEGDAPNAFIKKPYRIDEFVAVLRKVVESGAGPSERATSG